MRPEVNSNRFAISNRFEMLFRLHGNLHRLLLLIEENSGLFNGYLREFFLFQKDAFYHIAHACQGYKQRPMNFNYWSFLHYHQSTFLNCSVKFFQNIDFLTSKFVYMKVKSEKCYSSVILSAVSLLNIKESILV